METTCSVCQGAGKIIKNPCSSCYGQGKVNRSRKLKVSIPAGVEDGTKIRLSGEGEAGGHGAVAGDLYIFISIEAHHLFERHHDHIKFNTTIPMVTAILGGEIEVPIIDGGKSKVKIPEGTQSNKQFRLKAKGMVVMNSNRRGDMYISIDVETPVNLTDKQIELMKEFDEISKTRNNSPKSCSFTDRIKEFLRRF